MPMAYSLFLSFFLSAGPTEACAALAEVIPEIVMGSMGESKFDQVGPLLCTCCVNAFCRH